MNTFKVPISEYAQRRQKFLAQMDANAIAVFPAAPELHRSADGYYPFHQDTDFYYLSGFVEPNAVIVLAPNLAEGPFILFNQGRDPAKEIWHGRRTGQEGALREYGANKAYKIDDFVNLLPTLLKGHSKLYFAFGRNLKFDELITNAIDQLRTQSRSCTALPQEIINPETLLHEMRLYKSEAEITLMREAARISVEAHKAAIKACQPGLYEYSMEAELQYCFLKNGSHSPAYPSIVASGVNACCLHYQENSALLRAGDLLLIDAGCEYQYYASDVTRTFPVNGKYTLEQRAIYDIVLKAQRTVIDTIKPGIPWNIMHDTAVRVITEGLVQLGLLEGDVNMLIDKQAYFPFYMHRTGHWIGLDTHDVGQYQIDGKWRLLEAGMTFTVEPGIYIAPGMANVDPKWHGIGIRIEDDVLVTETGCEVLTHALPSAADEIEAMMTGIT